MRHQPDNVLAPIYERILAEERAASARQLNAIRPVVVAVFLIVYLATAERAAGPVCALAVFLGLAVVLLFGARASARAARWSALAVPFLDMPLVFLVQWLGMDSRAPHDDRAIADFSLGPLLMLVALSAFNLRVPLVVLAGFMAAAIELGLQFRAGDPWIGKAGGLATIAATAALCSLTIIRLLQMVARIAREQLRTERLLRYFSPQVAQSIQRDENAFAAGRLCEITVLFSDLRGFSTFSHGATPAQVMELLNQVHSRLVEVVFAHEGTLDKYLGDGLMAYFGAPLPQADHAARALRCAHAMKAAFNALNLTRGQEGKAPLRLSIGLHSGPALVGAIGAANRREFTVVGDTVNLAARMENLTRQYGTELLLSGATVKMIGREHEFRLLAETTVRGRAESVRIFEPL
jgi:adenylate cyclase